MARSGSYDFSIAGDAILRGAIRIIKGMGGSPPAGAKTGQAEITEAREALNMMLKEWTSRGIGIWLNKEISLFLAYRTAAYDIGSSSDHASLSVIETELSSSSAASATTLTVDSITGISSGDYIGIELNDDTLQWTTVNGAPSGSTITLTAALNSSYGADTDNNVYTYTTHAQRPYDVKEARLYRDNGTETPLYLCTRQEWFDLPNKEYNGTPSMVYYDRQLDKGKLYVWPRPNKVNDYIKFTCRYPIQDIDAAANDPDWPPELFRAVKFNLAMDLCHEYVGVDLNRYYAVRKRADYLFNDLISADTEYGSYFFKVDR